MAQAPADGQAPEASDAIAIPRIELPQGGGAIKGIDEKFRVNTANGTATFGVAIPIAPHRGLGPAVGLGYDSGSGNGPFGLGWSLTTAFIQRKTDKRLPRYDDANESDTFVLSGAEDLVPSLVDVGTGTWTADAFTAPAGEHVVRYRPRIESAFSRIERVTPPDSAASFWKVTTAGNVVTIYGRSASARVADPAYPERVFRWLPELSYDDKGECVEYTYVAENLVNAPDALSEQNRRNGLATFANTYLKSIRYTNVNPYYPDATKPYSPPPPTAPEYLFELVLDYGDHDLDTPTPDPSQPWSCRLEPFSQHKAGFEIRTYRLCRRLLAFNFFKELNDGTTPAPCLVHSVDIAYRFHDNPLATAAELQRVEVDYPISFTQTKYRKSGTAYEHRSSPSQNITYQEPAWSNVVQELAQDDLANLPSGTNRQYQWIDLWSEGIAGILAEQGSGWYYKRNLGNGQFTPGEPVIPKPSFLGLTTGTLSIQELDADGRKFAVTTAPPVLGFFEISDQDNWQPFRAFPRVSTADARDPNAKYIDLDGDGRPDLLVSEEAVFTWYQCDGTDGYLPPARAPKPYDEERGPALVFADETDSIFLADMTGDGLTDIVRIRNGEVCYWPNQGYGRFGAKVAMDGAPVFDFSDSFDPRYLHLGDINGTGANDIIYVGQNRVRAWLNRAGNGWSDAIAIDPFPTTELPSDIAVVDLLGNGTSCLVWSSELPANARSPLRYIDLLGGEKPFIATSYRNNLGKQVSWQYRSSTQFYLDDERAGRPWFTKLPFPVQCVSKISITDAVSRTYLTTDFRYHHGYYDHVEREYRGFGMVEQVDTETFDSFVLSGASNVVDEPLHQPPALSRTWFDVGAYFDQGDLRSRYETEYFQNAAFTEYHLPDRELPGTFADARERREAARACRSRVLRQETYGLDDTPDIPYFASEFNVLVQRVQPRNGDHPAVFIATPSEAITYGYEREPEDPRIVHTLNTVIDELGNVREAASVAYPRQISPAGLPAKVTEQQHVLHVAYARNAYTNDVITPSTYRFRASYESEKLELLGVTPAASWFQRGELAAAFAAAAPISYEAAPSGAAEKRQIGLARTLMLADDATTLLPLGTLAPLGLVGETYTLAFTSTLLTARFGGRATPAFLAEGHYVRSNDYKAAGWFPATDPDDSWWSPSGRKLYPATPSATFYQPDRYRDPFGAVLQFSYYSNYCLLIERMTDTVGNTTSVDLFDFRLIVPQRIRDANDNLIEARYDLLGYLVGTALLGKGSEADDFTGFVTDPAAADVAAFFADPVAHGPALLQRATARYIFDFSVIPARTATIARETHALAADASGTPSPLQYSFAYSNGNGSIAMTKVQATPGLAKQLDASNHVVEVDTTPNLRWIGTGRTVLNNKGKPVKQYEPYFSVTHAYEDDPALVEIGVTPIMYYDPAGRIVRTESPNGTLSRVETEGWLVRQYDQNDTVLDSSWYADRTTGPLASDVRENDAARKAAVHANTPSTSHVDTLGRPFYAAFHNHYIDPATLAVVDESYESYSVLDIQGRQLAIIDPRGNTIGTTDYDLRGAQVHRNAAETGEHWTLSDCAGKAMYDWNVKDGAAQVFHTTYDAVRRPSELQVTIGGAAPITVDRTSYGEGVAGDKAQNLRAKPYQHFDQGGVLTNVQYDFKGNLLATTLQLVSDYQHDIDWASAPVLDTDVFMTTSTYDALNRPTRVLAPSASAATANISIPTYNQSGHLATMTAQLRGAAAQTAFVTAIDYNEKGQRTRITYANGAATIYKYDPETFRLIGIVTARGRDPEVFWDDPTLLAVPANANQCLQFLTYTWDAAGNITYVRDDAQQTIYFNNTVVEPSCDYTFDATYRLIQAIGREHAGQSLPADESDSFRMNNPQPNDGSQMRIYTQLYAYDAAGNMLTMRNAGSWRRDFTYSPTGNQMLTAVPGGAIGTPFAYTYDEHGNMHAMQHLPKLEWTFKDDLRHVVLSATAGQDAWYNYTGGQRFRKVVQKGALREERIYLGNFERFRRYSGTTLVLERETFHIVDDKSRIAMVDTPLVVPAGDGEVQCIRYQHANHLGTACLEIDDHAQVISYEEYYPFGSTAYQATDQTREVASKRYRYIGKERDDETGLYYHGARYYAPWLARWTAADPTGTPAGLNLYSYCSNNPVTMKDPRGTDGEVCGVYDEEALVCRTEACEPASLSPEVPTGPPSSPTAPRPRIRRTQPPPPPAPPPPAPDPVYDGPSIGPMPQEEIDRQFRDRLLNLDLPPSQIPDTEETDMFAGLYSIAYGLKRSIYVPIREWVSPTPRYYLDSEDHVQQYTGPVDHTDVVGAIGQVGMFFLPGAGEADLLDVAAADAPAVLDTAVVDAPSVVEPIVANPATTDTVVANTAAADTTAVADTAAPAADTAAADSTAASGANPAPAGGSSSTSAVATTWRAHEAAVTEALEAANPAATVGEQVTLDVTNTATGETVRIRIDNLYPNASGEYQLVDAKFSAVRDLTSANLESTVTANQSVAYDWIRTGQPIEVVPQGARAAEAGLTPGTPISVAPTVEMHVNSAGGIVVRVY